MDAPDHAPEHADFANKIKSIAGLLVAGLAGAINFIGLKNDEVSTVLRNEAHWPTLILGLIVAGILTAVASVFVKPDWTVSHWAWLAAAGLLLVPVSLAVVIIRIPGITEQAEVTAGKYVASFGAVLAVGCSAVIFRKHLRRKGGRTDDEAGKSIVTAQGLLVFVAIALTATAAYAALRLETVSQLNSTAAQLSAQITETSGTALADVSIDASKMANVDRVNVSVTGLQRSMNILQFCAGIRQIGTLTCQDAPCFTSEQQLGRLSAACDVISSGIYQPNADGSVQQALTIPFSDVLFQRLELLGEVCTVQSPGQPCTYDSQNVTRIDIQIPEYTAPPSS